MRKKETRVTTRKKEDALIRTYFVASRGKFLIKQLEGLFSDAHIYVYT